MIGTLSTGDSVGEVALTTRAPRNATVRCVDETEVCVITRAHFEEMLLAEAHAISFYPAQTQQALRAAVDATDAHSVCPPPASRDPPADRAQSSSALTPLMSLSAETMGALVYELVKPLPLLRGADEGGVRALCRNGEYSVFLPGQRLLVAGQTPRGAYLSACPSSRGERRGEDGRWFRVAWG